MWLLVYGIGFVLAALWAVTDLHRFNVSLRSKSTTIDQIGDGVLALMMALMWPGFVFVAIVLGLPGWLLSRFGPVLGEKIFPRFSRGPKTDRNSA